MDERSRSSSEPEFYPSPSDIRLIESNVQAELKTYEKDFDSSILETSTVCDIVKEQVLNYKDESHLSKNQNNCRRIHIASQLMTDICLFHGNLVDYEFAKIVNYLLYLEKLKSISRKIIQKTNFEAERERYFHGEAQSRLLEFVTAGRDVEDQPIPAGAGCEVGQQVAEPESERTRKDAVGLEGETTELNVDDPAGRLHSASPSRGDFPCDAIGNVTEIRAEASGEASNLQIHIPKIQEVSFRATAEPEISFKAPDVNLQTEEDLQQILRILEDQLTDKELGAIDRPESSMESAEKYLDVTTRGIEELPPAHEKAASGLDTSDEWSLQSMESVERRRKKPTRLAVDPVTTIRRYAARALELNSQIQIERVQVYEGPPRFVQTFNVEYAMTTPGFRTSPVHGVRSSRLEALYARHLITKKKPSEAANYSLKRQIMEPQREMNASKAQTIAETLEETGTREGMHSVPGRSFLAEAPEKTLPADLDFSAAEVPNRESMVGVPMSRIMEPSVEPPDLERINGTRALQSPRVENLQGRSLEADATPPWHFTPKTNPPSGKWRDFNYVTGRLKRCWKSCQNQGLEKTVSLREILSLEGSGTTADYLTALRLLDKLSIQRKLVVEYANGDVIVKPFEVPYVSDKQLALRETDPMH